MNSWYRYLVLVLLLSAFGLMFLTLPAFRMASAVGLGLTYFVWGIVVHHLDKNLHLLVAAEYLAFSVLAVIILLSLFL